jgi:hypothetical protein
LESADTCATRHGIKKGQGMMDSQKPDLEQGVENFA